MRGLYLVLLVAAFALGGCSDEEDIYLPDPLVDIDNQFETKQLWSTNVAEGGRDLSAKVAPTLAYGNIYVAGGSGEVTAVNPDTGDKVWQVDLEVEIGGGPGVANNLVAVGTQEGELIVLDAKDGSEKWRKPVSSEVLSAPAVGEGFVVVRTVDGKITAFEADTGEQRWTYDQIMPSLTLRGESSPVIVGGGVISGFSNGKLAVFILETGRLAWEKTITTPAGYSEIQKLADVDIKPLVAGQEVFVGSFNGNLAAINAQRGETLWQRELSTFNEISVDDLLLLVTHENSFVSGLNRTNGAVLWTQKQLHRRQLSTPVAVGDDILVADYEGYVHWLSRNDGSMLSRTHIDSSGISAQPLVIGDKVILLSHSGDLYAIQKR